MYSILKLNLTLTIATKQLPRRQRRKFNVHKTFRRRPGRVLNVLCTFSLRPVSLGYIAESYFLVKYCAIFFNSSGNSLRNNVIKVLDKIKVDIWQLNYKYHLY